MNKCEAQRGTIRNNDEMRESRSDAKCIVGAIRTGNDVSVTPASDAYRTDRRTLTRANVASSYDANDYI